MNLDLEQAITIANNVILEYSQKNLTDVEIAILTGAWNREEYEFIATTNNYSTFMTSLISDRLVGKCLLSTKSKIHTPKEFEVLMSGSQQNNFSKVNPLIIAT